MHLVLSQIYLLIAFGYSIRNLSQ